MWFANDLLHRKTLIYMRIDLILAACGSLLCSLDAQSGVRKITHLLNKQKIV